ncbi:ImmA/IrrE family metallo-endopeptidase [Streptomyces boncukensis]|uniref:ImmA/IrrE family metallo-endopeptidase n=1 Tax=Streptomyces boncukensis TaxID=2711219 RepID=A0A6G4WTY7_9ACTN|nr:ImmA/IrrE family metallo-endopeptidase [Streptomyces boncukensis]NGO68004.1 ImmA/IrrE family metallo-endopeptidase [Streptomyces boncukensis]
MQAVHGEAAQLSALTLYDPWHDLASRPELTYGRTSLPGGAGGLWFPDMRAIAIDSGLGWIGARCALAHELAHVDLQHSQCAGHSPGALRFAQRQERQATLLAAKRLLPVTFIAAHFAEDVYLADMAADLNVTEYLLRLRLQTLNDEERTVLPVRGCAA